MTRLVEDYPWSEPRYIVYVEREVYYEGFLGESLTSKYNYSSCFLAMEAIAAFKLEGDVVGVRVCRSCSWVGVL